MRRPYSPALITVTAASASCEEVADTAGLGQQFGLFEMVLQRHRIGDLAALDQSLAALEDPAMLCEGEMIGLQVIRNPLEGVIVDEYGAEERHFGFDRMRQLAHRRNEVGKSRRSEAGRGKTECHRRARPL